jgi:hypothetical protein
VVQLQQHMEATGAVPANAGAAAAAGAGTADGSGATGGGDDVAWRQLIESPPWLSESTNSSSSGSKDSSIGSR